MDKDAYHRMKFLENFIEFGALHRARVAWSLVERFQAVPDEEESMRGSIALDVLQTHLNTYEDVVLWLQVVEGWNDEGTNITRLLEKAQFAPRLLEDAQSSRRQKEELDRLRMHSIIGGGGTGEQFARTFGFPYKDTDDWSGVNPASRERLRQEIDELARLSNVFFWGAHFVTESRELALWRAWNKTKHGLFVTLTRTETGGTVITVHTDPEDLSHAYELRVRYYDLAPLVAKTFVGCIFLARTLYALYHIRYQRVPEVSWLSLATAMDMVKISREKMRGVLAASGIPRQAEVLGFGPRTQARHFHPVFGWKLADDWWPQQK